MLVYYGADQDIKFQKGNVDLIFLNDVGEIGWP